MKRLLLLLLLFPLVFSCRAPRSVEQFVPAPGPYSFTVDMTDSTALYNLDLYTRVDAADAPSEVQLLMRWKSPSDSLYSEEVYLPLGKGRFSKEVYAPYRSGVQPAEWGAWQLLVLIPSVPEGFRGLGLVVKKLDNQ